MVKTTEPGGWQEGEIDFDVTLSVEGIGQIDVYIGKDGWQKSPTDKSCPFFDGSAKECRIWNMPTLLPPVCANAPQNMGERWSQEHAEEWMADHTSVGCGWSYK
jgi:hypothetical protein